MIRGTHTIVIFDCNIKGGHMNRIGMPILTFCINHLANSSYKLQQVKFKKFISRCQREQTVTAEHQRAPLTSDDGEVERAAAYTSYQGLISWDRLAISVLTYLCSFIPLIEDCTDFYTYQYYTCKMWIFMVTWCFSKEIGIFILQLYHWNSTSFQALLLTKVVVK